MTVGMDRRWFRDGWILLTISLAAGAWCSYYVSTGHSRGLRWLCVAGGIVHIFNACRVAYAMLDEGRA